VAAPGDDALWREVARLVPNDLENLEISYDADARILWYFMRPGERPAFTFDLLYDIRRLQERVERLFDDPGLRDERPVRYLVLASSMAGIFNFGGDLRLIARLVHAKDREQLEIYARACIDVLHPNATALDLPIVPVSLVEGHALGGGFEAALSGSVIIATEEAKFGLPEVLFNLFPGMGAYSLLSRRIGSAAAERMIVGGKVFTARELHQTGIVDTVAQNGRGEDAVYELANQQNRRFNSHVSIYQARRRVHRITYDEVWDIASVWVDAALRLTAADLRKVDRLAASQDRMSTISVQRGG
jgi:DSF synthase